MWKEMRVRSGALETKRSVRLWREPAQKYVTHAKNCSSFTGVLLSVAPFNTVLAECVEFGISCVCGGGRVYVWYVYIMCMFGVCVVV